MKRILCALLSALLLLTLTACGGKKPAEDPSVQPPVEQPDTPDTPDLPALSAAAQSLADLRETIRAAGAVLGCAYLGSTNGTYVDGMRVTRTVLRNGAVINVPAQVFAFTVWMLHYHAHQSGISIQLVNVYKTVKNANTGRPLNIVDGTSIQVEPTSFVVLVGGSGTGKSSLLT